MQVNRRTWFKTTAGLLLAPAIVRPESLMVVKSVSVPKLLTIEDVIEAMWANGARATFVQHVIKSNALYAHAIDMTKLEISDAS